MTKKDLKTLKGLGNKSLLVKIYGSFTEVGNIEQNGELINYQTDWKRGWMQVEMLAEQLVITLDKKFNLLTHEDFFEVEMGELFDGEMKIQSEEEIDGDVVACNYMFQNINKLEIYDDGLMIIKQEKK